MKSAWALLRRVYIRHTLAAAWGMVWLAAGVGLFGQPIPASLTTIGVPTYGQAVFDSSGNQYYMEGPVTPGSAQPNSGGGTCVVLTGGFLGPGMVYETCTDAQIVKIDPTGKMVFGTNLGGPTADSGAALAVDSAGNVVITGSTGGQFPTTAGSAIPSSTTATTFAARLTADGTAFAYVTYLPDSIIKTTGIAVDAEDNAYISGTTNSGAAAVIALSADGSTILYNLSFAPGPLGQYAGQLPASIASAITVDPSGNAIVAGSTSATNFPVTSGALQPALAGTRNLFLMKLDPSGNVLFSTYLGGSGSDTPAVVQSDSSGGIYVAGFTSSLDFPTTAGTMQPTAAVPLWNNYAPAGFAAKVASDGSALAWSTYVMSLDQDQTGVSHMSVTPDGQVYLAGLTGGTFPMTASSPAPCISNSSAGFVAHLNAQGALADSAYINDPPEYNPPNDVLGLGVGASGSVQVVFQYSGTNTMSTLQFGGPGYTAPVCVSSNVMNAANQYSASPAVIAPAEMLTLTGFGMGPATGVAAAADAKGDYPTQLGGVKVMVNGVAAPVLYASSQQINLIAPASIPEGCCVNIQVIFNNQQLPLATAFVQPAFPAAFRVQPGVSAQAYVTNQDGTLNTAGNPAVPGSVVSVLATGLGTTAPACTVGGPNVSSMTGLAPGVTATASGLTVTYAGSAPGFACGIQRVSFQIPSNAEAGTYNILLGTNTETGFQIPVIFSIAVGN